MAGRTILMFAAVGGIFVGSCVSAFDFSSFRGLFFLGAYVGLRPEAASRLTDPNAPRRTEG